MSYEIPANNGYSGGAQTAVAGHRRWPRCAANPAIDFIVAYFHHCAYCTCTAHGSEGGVAPVLDPAVRPVQRRPGHQRPQPHLRAHRPADRRVADLRRPDRLHHHPGHAGHHVRVAGGAGESLYNFNAPDSYEGDVNDDTSITTLRQRARRQGRPDRRLVAGPLHRLLPAGGRQRARPPPGRHLEVDRPRPERGRPGARPLHPGPQVPVLLIPCPPSQARPPQALPALRPRGGRPIRRGSPSQ